MLVWDAIAKEALADYETLRSEEQTIWVVELLNGEIANGGLVQYFANTSGEHVDGTVEALKRIGAFTHLAVFEEAVARWRLERSTLEPLWETLEGFSRSYEVSRLPQLDDGWYEVAIEPFEAAFIRANLPVFAS